MCHLQKNPNSALQMVKVQYLWCVTPCGALFNCQVGTIVSPFQGLASQFIDSNGNPFPQGDVGNWQEHVYPVYPVSWAQARPDQTTINHQFQPHGQIKPNRILLSMRAGPKWRTPFSAWRRVGHMLLFPWLDIIARTWTHPLDVSNPNSNPDHAHMPSSSPSALIWRDFDTC